MEKLFKDSETFQKDRPTKATDEQIIKMYSDLSDEIIERGWNDDYTKESIIADLTELNFTDAAFEKAKTMDDFGGYNMDVDFIEWLDDLYWKKGELIEKNVKEWVKAHDIKQAYEKGTKLIATKTINIRIPEKSILFITGYRLETACYLVDKDKNRNGGTVLEYEKVYETCKRVDQ